MGIFISILVLSVLIIFHEFGHFIAARYFGVKVEEFGLGMPIIINKPWFKKKFGDTTYSFYPLLLGGFVRMKGQDDFDPAQKSSDSDSYQTKKPWQKIIILLAGPFANLLLAFLLYIAIAYLGAEKLAPKIGNLSSDFPAALAGVEINDTIKTINGVDIVTWDNLSDIIKNSQGELNVTVERKGKIKSFVIMPKLSETKNIFGETISKKLVGIAPAREFVTLQFQSPLEVFKYAWQETISATDLIVKSLQKLISGIIPADQMGGIVSIVQVTSQATTLGLTTLFALAALISVNLGVLNLLPIPALDGGHIMFNLYEIIFRKAPSEKVFYLLTVLGWIFLLSLMAFTTFNDISRIIGAE